MPRRVGANPAGARNKRKATVIIWRNPWCHQPDEEQKCIFFLHFLSFGWVKCFCYYWETLFSQLLFKTDGWCQTKIHYIIMHLQKAYNYSYVRVSWFSYLSRIYLSSHSHLYDHRSFTLKLTCPLVYS